MALATFGCFLVLVLLATGVSAVKVAVAVNSSTVRQGSSLWMNCSYDLEGDVLYSIKWYKGSYEFYRFMPVMPPQQRYFHLRGLQIDRNKTKEGDVFITSAGKASQDLYRCEVSTDAPSFSTAAAETELIVDDGEPQGLPLKQESVSCPETGEIAVSAKRRGKKIVITLHLDDD